MDAQRNEPDTELGCINRLVGKLCAKARNEGLQQGIDALDVLSRVVPSSVTKEWLIAECERKAEAIRRLKVWID